MLRVTAARTVVYFKASVDLPLFVNEPLMMKGLAELYPRQVPAPLAIDAERRWMLLPDLGTAIDWEAPLAQRAAALEAFAALQVDSSARLAELLELGCLDRRLTRLEQQIDPLLDALPAFDGLEVEQVARLRQFGPRLKELCAELAEAKIPPALVHGDLHMSNIVFRGEDYQFFDWTDPSVAHPFFDGIVIQHEKDPSSALELRERYLTAWSEFETMERLREVWALAYPLCALHQAVSYQHIILNVEAGARPDFAWAMPFWTAKILAPSPG